MGARPREDIARPRHGRQPARRPQRASWRRAAVGADESDRRSPRVPASTPLSLRLPLLALDGGRAPSSSRALPARSAPPPAFVGEAEALVKDDDGGAERLAQTIRDERGPRPRRTDASLTPRPHPSAVTAPEASALERAPVAGRAGLRTRRRRRERSRSTRRSPPPPPDRRSSPCRARVGCVVRGETYPPRQRRPGRRAERVDLRGRAGKQRKKAGEKAQHRTRPPTSRAVRTTRSRTRPATRPWPLELGDARVLQPACGESSRRATPDAVFAPGRREPVARVFSSATRPLDRVFVAPAHSGSASRPSEVSPTAATAPARLRPRARSERMSDRSHLGRLA
jgi:hypothetical protein